MRAARTALLGGLTAGVGLLGYALIEARMPVLRRVDVPVLAAGEQPLRILHLADLHLTDRTEARVDWVRSLADTHPDVVVNTGDNLSFASGLEPLGRALEPFLHLPGAFVMGDHDYRTTVFKLPTRYLRRDPRAGDDPAQEAAIEGLPWQEVRDLQAAGGWADLTNARGTITVGARRIEAVGVDDPHVNRDAFPAPAPAPDAAAVRDFAGRPLRLGLAHAPYRRVLDAMTADGVGLTFAGHTHGGQLCLPWYGALVTNCDLDRGRASGLSPWPGARPGASGGDRMFLHVSAGLGTSPYTPVRVACRPEATLLTLRPAA
ncbi:MULTISPECIES: metallophosphoesterase [unclassified Actinomyces]|uniref:metallophosphoesterase n=1 Tax=unclassified Actinomyces TaxID=2609248 RepID=UPI0013A69C20|nr:MULTISPECIES: metallophosphoesterase [unclassified Actinomyces]MBW3068446.1 metallophosphoesterase [Actinomyces sp. 594]NDR54348.1 metallophosphoesterase [Actinomyces sp. 565]